MKKNVASYTDINLRNFRLPDNIYFAIESIAAGERRNANDELILAMEQHIEAYKERKGISEIELTPRRIERLKAKK